MNKLEQALKLYTDSHDLWAEAEKLQTKSHEAYYLSRVPDPVYITISHEFALQSHECYKRGNALNSKAWKLWIEGLTETFGYIPDFMRDMRHFV